MTMTIEQGEIYRADLEELGRRKVIVISREELNRGRTVTVVPVTSRRFAIRSKLAHCVAFRAGEHGFTQDCVAQCENATVVPVEVLDAEPVDRLPDEVIREVIRAVGSVMDADCEPCLESGFWLSQQTTVRKAGGTGSTVAARQQIEW